MSKKLKGSIAITIALAAASAIAQDAPPTISSWSPHSGAPLTTVTIAGTKLGQVTEVDFFNGKVGTITKKVATTIQVTVPADAVSGPIKLVTPANGTITLTPDFTVTDGGGTGGGGGGTGGSGGTFIDPPHYKIPAGSMSGHPRIFLTSADVPKYQAWATASNPMWQDLKAAATTGKQRMDSHLVPNQDEGDGSGNYSPYPTEQYAELFAFMSLVDPNAANRADYAHRAHDLIMYVFNIAAQGAGPNGTPFRMPAWSIYNRSRWYGEAFPCVVDWCYQTFTPAEKATIRKVFLRWIQENLVASVTSAEHPQPVGVVNNSQLISDKLRLRWAANNYYCNHARQIGLMALALDATDDVPLLAGDKPSGTCRDFIGNAIGAWLYQVDQEEKSSTAGGMSPEGLGYGESDQSAIAMLLLGMHTSGVDKRNPYGAQAEMASGQFWSHDVLDSYIHAMSPAKVTQFSWIGQSNLPADYADVQGYQIYNYIRVWGPLALMARSRGDQATYDKVRWMIDQYEPGSGFSRDYQLSGCLDNYGALLPIFYYMVCDPMEAAKPDPRSAMPTDFYSAGLGRLLSRTDWSPTASWFTFKCSWITTDHNPADGNKFEFYRKGEWLTKGRQGYGFDVNEVDLQNTVSIENPVNTSNWFWGVQASHGGQFSYEPAGDPKVHVSSGPGYSFVFSDALNVYNCPVANATDVKAAQRSILWLKPDMMVIYDRTGTGATGRYKRWYMNTEKLATVNGKVATVTTPKGQKLFVTSVLPTTSVITPQAVPTSPTGPDANETVEDEFMLNRIMIQDPTKPKACYFLNVLQGADSGATPVATTVLHETSGEFLDGVSFGNTAVMFCRQVKATTILPTVFTVPATSTDIFMAGLKPGAAYTVTKTAVAGGIQVSIVPGGPVIADAAGLVKI